MSSHNYPTREEPLEEAPETVATLDDLIGSYRELLRSAGYTLKEAEADPLLVGLAIETARIHTILHLICRAVAVEPSESDTRRGLAAEWLAPLPAVGPLLERLAEQEPDFRLRSALRDIVGRARAKALGNAVPPGPPAPPDFPHPPH